MLPPYDIEYIKTILKQIPEGVISIDILGNVILINETAEMLLGCSAYSSIGKHVNDVLSIYKKNSREPILFNSEEISKPKNELTSSILDVIVTSHESDAEISGSIIPVRNDNDQILGFIILFSGSSERKKTEEELKERLRIESLGKLTGGIAHGFNNIFTGILGNISLAKMSLSEGNEIYSLLTEAESGIEKAKKLSQQVLTFAHGDSSVKQAIKMSEFIKESIILALSGGNIVCKFSIDENLSSVNGLSSQLNQAINNIVINACEAMPSGGIIEVSAYNVHLEHGAKIPLKEGSFVKISIVDHGIGIPEEDLDLVFEPFFTTKLKEDEMTSAKGLGLTIARSIINEHEGYIFLESELGIGTSVHIYLPAIKEQKREKEKLSKTIHKGKGKILVMDDEEMIRTILGKMLHQLGYEAELAKDGEEAVQIYKEFKEKGKPFDVVILDLTVRAGMSGKDAIKYILEYDPDATAIASSGYSTDPMITDYEKFGFSGVLKKPYKIKDLDDILWSFINKSSKTK